MTSTVRNYLIVTASYWGFTLVDGALRMLVLSRHRARFRRYEEWHCKEMIRERHSEKLAVDYGALRSLLLQQSWK